MDLNQGLDLARDALIMALVISAPVMAIGMFVGLLISLFQSVTQLQEQTLSFVPKILAMVGIGLVLAPWLTGKLLDYAVELFAETPF